MNKNVMLSFLILVFSCQFNFAQIRLIPYDSVRVSNEFGMLKNAWAGGLNCPQFSEIDLDGDGKKDLVAFERNFYGYLKTYINQANSGQADYIFAPEYQLYFPEMRNWMLLRDYNCDGKEDIFTSVPAGVAVYRNDSDPGSGLKFTLVTPLLQTIGLNGQTPLYVSPPDIPSISDIDNDGDLDILSFNILGSTVEYHKNLSMEKYGNCDELEYELKNACWGYFSEDGNNNTVILHDTCDENVPNPEKSARHAGSTILSIDLKGNGVKDLVLGDLTYNNLVQLSNGGTTTSAEMVASDTAFPPNTQAVNLTVFPAAYNIDVDNDGLKDLIVAPNNPNTSENYNNIWFYKNIGTALVPEFSFQQNDFLEEEMIDAGERSFPVFFDENNDGLEDIIIGNFGYFISTGSYSSQLMLLRNTGTGEKPSFQLISSDYAGLSVYGFNGIYPTFGDIDNDGDKDMLIGDEDGNLHYFRNDASPGNPADFTLSQPNYKEIDIGQSAKPQIVDANRDGLPDLLIGERSGTVNYFENTGTPENSDFSSQPTNEEFGQIDVMPECCTGYSAPFMVDDSVGNNLLYVGSEQGKLFLYNNIENNLNGVFNLVDSLYLHGVNVNVSGTDINKNGQLEFVVGEYSGGIGLLKFGNPPSLGIDSYQTIQHVVDIFPNPATNNLFIRLKDHQQKNTISISMANIFGQVIMEQKFANNSEISSVDVSDINPGVYFIRVEIDNDVVVKKFIKE